MSTGKKKLYETLLLVNTIQEHLKTSGSPDTVGFNKLHSSLSSETSIAALTQVLPIVLAAVTTNLETFVSVNLNLDCGSAPAYGTAITDQAKLRCCGSILTVICSLVGQSKQAISVALRDSKLGAAASAAALSRSVEAASTASYLLQLILKQAPLFGRLLFSVTVLLENLKGAGPGSVANASTAGTAAGGKGRVDPLKAVVLTEHAALLLDTLTCCLFPWSSEHFSALQTACAAAPASAAAAPAGMELRPVLPRSLTGPYLAQALELLLHFSTRLTPPASLDVRRVSCRCLDALGLLVDILRCCPSAAPPDPAAPTAPALLASVPVGVDQDPSVWRSYFPGLYSALQTLCLDKTLQRGSRLQTLALSTILTLATAVMADSVNCSSIRNNLVGSAAGTVALPDEQSHHFDLLLSKLDRGSGQKPLSPAAAAAATAGARIQPVPVPGADGSLSLPEPTELSLSWRTDLLQRLSAHFPAVFRHVFCAVNAKLRAVLIERLCLFTASCKEFLGSNGLSFVVPLLLLGFTDTAVTGAVTDDDEQGSSAASPVSESVSDDVGGAGSPVLSSPCTLLLEDIISGKITFAPTVTLDGAPTVVGAGLNDRSDGGSGRVLWEQSVKSILVSTLATCTQRLMDLASGGSSGPALLSGTNSAAGASDVAIKATLSSAIGCLFLLKRSSVRSMFVSPASDAPVEAGGLANADLGRKFVYVLVYLLAPVGSVGAGWVRGASGGAAAGSLGSAVTLLEERKYCAITEFEATVGDDGLLAAPTPVFGTVTAGYYRLSWEHLSDPEGRALARRLSFYLGRHMLLPFLLASAKPLERTVHSILRKLAKAKDNTTAGDASGKRKSKKSKRKVDSDTGGLEAADSAAKAPALQIEDSASAAGALSVRVQSWCQSISVWRLIGFAVLGSCCSGYDRLCPAASRTALRSEKRAAASRPKRPQCAVCLRFEAQSAPPAAPAPLSRCVRCKAVYYCCREHQTKDWASHKLVCQLKKSTVVARSSTTAADAATEVTDEMGVGGSLLLEHHLVDPETLLVSPVVVHSVCAQLQQGDGGCNSDGGRGKSSPVLSMRAPFLVRCATSSSGGLGDEAEASADPASASVHAGVAAVVNLCLAELRLYLDCSVVGAQSAVTPLANSSSWGLSIQSAGGRLGGPSHERLWDGIEDAASPAAASIPVISPLEQSLMAVRMSRVLECLGHCCFVLHHGFRRLLLDSLYVLLELSVASSFVVKQAADATLLRVALYCGYGSVRELYRENLDYIVDPLCDSLRRNKAEMDGAPVTGVDVAAMFSNSLVLSRYARRNGGARTRRPGGSGSSFVYSSFRVPAIVDMVFGHFGHEAYAQETASTGPLAMPAGGGGGGAVPLLLLRDMVGDVMQSLDALASTQVLDTAQVHSMLNVLRIIANRAVQLPLQLHASTFSGNSRMSLSAADADADANSLSVVARSFASFLSVLDALELPGATGPDPDVAFARRRRSKREVEEAAVRDSGRKEEDPLEDVDLDDLRRRSPGLVLLLEVLKRCAYFVASEQLDAQVVVVQTMRACIERLSPSPRLFLPAVHQAWSPLMSRAKEQLSVLRHYYNRLGPLTPPFSAQTVTGPKRSTTDSLLSVPSAKLGNSPVTVSGAAEGRDASLLLLESNAVSRSPAAALLSSALTSGSSGSASSAANVAAWRQSDADLVSNPAFMKRKLHLFPELLGLLATIAVLTTDFVASKMEEDFFPLLLDALLHLSRESLYRLETSGGGGGSGSEARSEGSTAALECQAKLAIVAFLHRCARTAGCQSYVAKVLPSSCVLLLPFLSSVEPQELREKTLGLFRALQVVDPSFVEAVVTPVVAQHKHLSGGKGPGAGVGAGEAGMGGWLRMVTDPRVYQTCRALFVKSTGVARQSALQQIKQSYAGQRTTKLMEDLNSTSNPGAGVGGPKRFKVGSFAGLNVFPADRLGDAAVLGFRHLLVHLARNRGVAESLSGLRPGAGSGGENAQAPAYPPMTAVWKKSIERNTHM